MLLRRLLLVMMRRREMVVLYHVTSLSLSWVHGKLLTGSGVCQLILVKVHGLGLYNLGRRCSNGDRGSMDGTIQTVGSVGQRRLSVGRLLVLLGLLGFELLVRDGLGNDVGEELQVIDSSDGTCCDD